MGEGSNREESLAQSRTRNICNRGNVIKRTDRRTNVIDIGDINETQTNNQRIYNDTCISRFAGFEDM